MTTKAYAECVSTAPPVAAPTTVAPPVAGPSNARLNADLQVCQDWHAAAAELTLHQLETTVLALRAQLAQTTTSSDETVALEDQLQVYEEVLTRRQRRSRDVDEMVAIARRAVHGVVPFSPEGLVLTGMSAQVVFVQGFLAGCIGAIPPGRAAAFRDELEERFPDFYLGYLKGVAVGLGHGLLGLLETLGFVAKLALAMSPAGQVFIAGREAFRFAEDPEAYLDARLRDIEQVRRLQIAIENLLAEVAADPGILIQWSADVGTAVGEEAGRLVTEGFLRLPIEEKGKVVGDFVGQILFEVLLELILAAVTAGVGNAIRGAGAAAQGARGAGRLARVLRGLMETSPITRRFLATIAGQADEAMSLSRAARRGVEAVEGAASTARTAERVAAAVPTPPRPSFSAHADGAGTLLKETKAAPVEFRRAGGGVAEASASPQPPRRPTTAEDISPESPDAVRRKGVLDDFEEASGKGSRPSDQPEGTDAVGDKVNPRTSAQFGDADILAHNLERALGGRPPGHHAHHLVPKGMKQAEEARDILEAGGIGINDAENGAWLARDYLTANPATGEIHSTLHTNRYIEWLTGELREAAATGGPAGVRRRLATLREIIMNGRVIR